MAEYADITLDSPLLINSYIDTRQKDKIISSHSSQYCKISEKIKVVSSKLLSDIDVSKYKIIGIDEAQFFPDLFDTVNVWVNELGKIVYCAGLSVDANSNLFGDIYKLLTFCDTFKLLTSKCLKCYESEGKLINAMYTAKKKEFKNQQKVDVGGSEKYYPLCRNHFIEHVK